MFQCSMNISTSLGRRNEITRQSLHLFFWIFLQGYSRGEEGKHAAAKSFYDFEAFKCSKCTLEVPNLRRWELKPVFLLAEIISEGAGCIIF